MTDFTARQQQQAQQPPQQLRLAPLVPIRPPYFDFNDIFGRSAGKKQSPPVATTTAAGVAPAPTTNSANNNNNNNSVNVNNNGGCGGGSIKQQQQQSSVAGQQQQQQQSAAAGCCPVCGAALRTAHELESHFVWELERLYKQAAAAGRRHRRGTPDKMGDGHHHNGLMVCARDGGAGRLSPVASGSGRDGSLHGRWEVRTANIYFRIKKKKNEEKSSYKRILRRRGEESGLDRGTGEKVLRSCLPIISGD